MLRRALDLYSGAGGAAWGYDRVGYEVFGVDLNRQRGYPFWFCQMDALEALRILLSGGKLWFSDNGYRDGDGPGRWLGLEDFDLIHASPPCQHYSLASQCRPGLAETYPDLIDPTRELLEQTGLPWVIENVEEAPLRDPVTLCGQFFHDKVDLAIRTYRHRKFETNFHLPQPPHDKHRYPLAKMGRPPQPNEFMHIVGHFSGVEEGKRAMGIHWMTRDELVESIPPAYTEYVGTWAWHAIQQHRTCCVSNAFGKLTDRVPA